ncbi:MAG: ABC transporter permease [Aristaeellaceae bacterium]
MLLIPVLVWYLVFCYGPMYGLVTAFQDYNMNKGVTGSPFVGLKHFEALMKDKYFWRAFRNTLIIALYRILFVFPVGAGLALLLNELKPKLFKKTVQTCLYLPHFLSWVIAASIVIAILSPDTGLVDGICRAFGWKTPVLLTKPAYFRRILVVSEIWKEAGWNTIIYVATIAGIEQSQYEAAYVDGAGRWKQMLYITLPGLLPTVMIMLILTVGQIMNTGFDQVYNLYNARVYATGDIIDTYIFRTVLSDNKLSYAASAGLFKSVIGTLLLAGTNFASRKITGNGIF